MKAPIDFLIIGAPKCGTTSLYESLSRHPQIYMPEMKEPHYFSAITDGKPHWGVKNAEEYRALFQSAPGGTLRGEASTWYLYSRGSAAEIHRQAPDAKLIAMLRHPADRAYSSYNFRVQMGWEPAGSFQEALRRERSRIAEAGEWDFHYLRAGRYTQQLKRYFDRFPPSQIFVGLFEDLTTDPHSLLKQLCRFLEIDPPEHSATSGQANVTYRPRHPRIKGMLMRSGAANWARIAAPKALRNLARQLVDAPSLTRKPPPLHPELRARITKKFRSEILELQELIGRDLAHWL